MTDHGPPPLTACKLWAKTSANGRHYLVGRLGGLRVLIFENRDRANVEDASHVLMFGQAADRAPGAAPRSATLQATQGRGAPEGGSADARERRPPASRSARPAAAGPPPFDDEPLPPA